jgi:hypothetical protein
MKEQRRMCMSLYTRSQVRGAIDKSRRKASMNSITITSPVAIHFLMVSVQYQYTYLHW